VVPPVLREGRAFGIRVVPIVEVAVMWNDALLKNTLAPLILRLALAVIFVYHGWHKITDRGTDWGAMWATNLSEEKDKPPPEVVNRLQTYVEMQQEREKAGQPVDNPPVVTKETIEGVKLAYHKVGEAHFTRSDETPAVQLNSSIQLLVAWGEVVGGVVLLLGFLTRWAALGLIAIQVGAIVLVTGARGFAPTGETGYEYNVALVAMCLALVFLGSGTLALNRLFWRSPSRPAHAPEPAPALR
jgi:uncharacterized membrane protein YphA (DoxX/SURF4 family)